MIKKINSLQNAKYFKKILRSNYRQFKCNLDKNHTKKPKNPQNRYLSFKQI